MGKPESEIIAAEHEMFAAVLSELFLGVLAEYPLEDWYDAAVHRLSRGAAPKLWSSLTTAHRAGTRVEPLASAQAEAIENLCASERKPAGPYDFPAELTVLVVTREVAKTIHARTRSGVYGTADDVVGSAMHALEWAENDPEGKRALLRYALAAGLAAEEAGQMIPAEVAFAQMRERARGR